jgi:Fe/S biogenesis protein NfuA
MAREQILAAMSMEGSTAQGLRLTVKHAGTRNQTYGLSLVEKSALDVNDVVVTVDGIRVFLEKHNIAFVDGATIDFLPGPNGSGFKIESPYKPTAVEIPTNPPTGPMADAVLKVIREQVIPSVASHGGYVSLVDIRDDVVFVRFGGGCQGCGMADVTLKQGVATMIKKAVPGVKDVLDITDHANGANPYYQAH